MALGPPVCLLPYLLPQLFPTFSESFFLRFGRGRIEKSMVRARFEEQDVDDVQLFLGTKGHSGKGPE